MAEEDERASKAPKLAEKDRTYDDQHCKIVCFYNHKGGVGKTSTTYTTGIALAAAGKRVLMVDIDPQYSLSFMCLKRSIGDEDIAEDAAADGDEAPMPEWPDFPGGTVYSALNLSFDRAPGQESTFASLRLMSFAEGGGELHLCPGHMNMSIFEVKFSTACNLMPIGLTPPMALSLLRRVCKRTAKDFRLDYILLDTAPSFSTFTQNILLTSDLLVLPCMPDMFSPMAIRSVRERLEAAMNDPMGHKSLFSRHDGSYPSFALDPLRPKLLGAVVSNVRYIGNNDAIYRSHLRWINRTQHELESLDRTLGGDGNRNLIITKIRDFISHNQGAQINSIPCPVISQRLCDTVQSLVWQRAMATSIRELAEAVHARNVPMFHFDRAVVTERYQDIQNVPLNNPFHQPPTDRRGNASRAGVGDLTRMLHESHDRLNGYFPDAPNQ